MYYPPQLAQTCPACGRPLTAEEEVRGVCRKCGFTGILAALGSEPVHCVRCGYNLRGSPSDRCSECGTHVRVTIDAMHRGRVPRRRLTFGWYKAMGWWALAMLTIPAALLAVWLFIEALSYYEFLSRQGK
jgi:hypothetical protein